jgi:hypothetical protein
VAANKGVIERIKNASVSAAMFDLVTRLLLRDEKWTMAQLSLSSLNTIT